MDSNTIISSGILELYVLGKTTAEETVQVEQWRAQYPEVAAEIDSIEDALYELDLQNALPVNGATKSKILEQIDLNEQNTPVVAITKNSARNGYRWVAAASICLLLGASIAALTMYNKFKQSEQSLVDSRKKLTDLENQVASLNQQLEVPLNDFSQQVVLKGTEGFPKSTAKLFYVKNTNDVYIEASGLPSAPSGFQYQLWAIIDGKPVDGGVIEQSGKKYNIQKMKSFGKVQAFAITLEKSGGSLTPSLDKMYVFSEM